MGAVRENLVHAAARPAPVNAAYNVFRNSLAPAVTAAFALLAIGLSFALSISQDESYSLHTASGGFVYALRQGIVYEAQAPLYFGVLAVWRALGDSLFAARLLSLAFSLVTLAITWRFATRYIRSISPVIVLAGAAFNPFMIWAAVETRPYAAAVTLSFALLYYFFRGWIDDGVNWPARAAFTGIAIAGAYTQYYIATFVAAGAVGLLVSGKRNVLFSYLLVASAVGLALTPILFMVPGQLEAYSPLVKLSLRSPFAVVLAVFEFLYPHHWMGSWLRPVLQNALYFCAALIPAALCFLWLRHIDRHARVLAAITATLAIIFAAFIGIVHVDVVFPRQTAVLFGPTLFTAFALVGSLGKQRRPIVLATFGAIYACLVCLSLWSDYRGFSKFGDWRRVGEYLQTHAASTDAVVAFDAEVELPLGYYYRGLPITSIPRPLSFERFDVADFVIHNEAELHASLGRATHDRRRVWLVLNELCATFPKYFGCDRLDAYIARNFTTIRVVSFNGSSVSELRPRETASVGRRDQRCRRIHGDCNPRARILANLPERKRASFSTPLLPIER